MYTELRNFWHKPSWGLILVRK